MTVSAVKTPLRPERSVYPLSRDDCCIICNLDDPTASAALSLSSNALTQLCAVAVSALNAERTV